MSSDNFLPVSIICAVLASFIVIGLRLKIQEASEYGVAGRYTGRLGGGAAIASNWMSAASFMGIAGLLYLKGYFALAYVIGWTGGYVLLLVLMASQIRRFGKYTAPDFVGDRYASPAARLISATISIGISIIYCVAQFKGIGMVFSWLFGITYAQGVVFGCVAVLSFVVISGMLGVPKNHQMQYFILIVSFIVPLMAMAYKGGYFWVLPQFGYGEAMQELSRNFGIDLAAPFASGTLFEWIALCFTLMVGTAGLPHVLSRFYVVPNVRDARWSVAWGLFFIALIYWSAPAYSVFARLQEAKAGATPDAATASAAADMVVINTAVNAGLSPWLVGLLAAGAVSAAFSVVAGLLATGAASFSHDIYYRLINTRASQSRKMKIAKGSVLVLGVLVAAIALDPPGHIAEITAVAFALAGNTIFPVFVLGIWWGRANRQGAIAGMITGTIVTFAAPLFGTAFPILTKVIPATSSALVGAPLAIAVIIVVSLFTPPPPDEIRKFLGEVVHGKTE